MTSPLLLRRATLADLPAILALVQQVVPLTQASDNHQWSLDIQAKRFVVT